MSYEVEFRISAGRQYEYLNFKIVARNASDLDKQVMDLNSDLMISLGRTHAAMSGAILHGHATPSGGDDLDRSVSPGEDERTPQQLVEQELGGRLVAVQEQAVEAPRKAWEIDLPTAPKAWKGVAAEAVKAQAAVEYPSGPPVESPKEKFPF